MEYDVNCMGTDRATLCAAGGGGSDGGCGRTARRRQDRLPEEPAHGHLPEVAGVYTPAALRPDRCIVANSMAFKKVYRSIDGVTVIML